MPPRSTLDLIFFLWTRIAPFRKLRLEPFLVNFFLNAILRFLSLGHRRCVTQNSYIK